MCPCVLIVCSFFNSSVWVWYNLFIQIICLDRLLGTSQFVEIVLNRTTMSIFLELFMWTFVFIPLGMKNCWVVGWVYVKFHKQLTSSQSDYTIILPSAVYENSLDIIWLFLKKFSLSWWMCNKHYNIVVSICIFLLIFFKVSMFLMCLLIVYIPLWNIFSTFL